MIWTISKTRSFRHFRTSTSRGAGLTGARVAGIVLIGILLWGSRAAAADGVRGIAVDARGNIYVLRAGPDEILIYPAGAKGNTAPKRTIAGYQTDLNDPIDIAADATGRTYVLNANDGRPCETINVYGARASGNAAPAAEIGGASTGFCGRTAGKLAVAPDGTAFLSIPREDAVLSFDRGSDGNVAPSSRLAGQVNAKLHQPFPIAAFSGTGLFVASQASWPGEDLEQTSSGAQMTYGKQLRPDLRYFGARNGDSPPLAKTEVTVFALGSSPTGWALVIPTASEADSSAPRAEVDVFAADGEALKKHQAITGPSTGLVAPIAVTADASGRIFVLDDRCRSRETSAVNPAVLVYAPGSDGDVKPAAVITGWRTGLTCP